MNTSLTEGTPEQSKFHLACVDGSHGRVAETTNTKRGFQLHLSPCLGPQPAEKKESAVITVIISLTISVIVAYVPNLLFL